MTRWVRSHRFDPRACALADRHYSRRKVGSPQFVPPGRNLVLLTEACNALWVTLEQRHVEHAWPGAWCCCIFRNESKHLSSELILEALRFTVETWGPFPPAGFITFVDPLATLRRRGRLSRPGACFRHAGFLEVGTTAAGHGRTSKVVLKREVFP